LEEEIDKATGEFEAFIKDKNIPLIKRWKTFVEGHGVGLTDRYPDMCCNTGVGLEYLLNHCFNAPELYGRGKEINLVSRLCNCIDLKTGELHPEIFISWSDCNKSEMQTKTESLLISTLEEIMEQNIGTFCYDW
jgi:hypothetical protein